MVEENHNEVIEKSDEMDKSQDKIQKSEKEIVQKTEVVRNEEIQINRVLVDEKASH